MAILRNPKHELFAQGLAAGKTADEAYQEAGYTENRGNAVRLKTNESIRARLAELQGRSAERVVITRQWVLERLRANMEAAHAKGQFGPANRALELLGRECEEGVLFIERKEVGAPGDFDKMSTDELREYLRREAAEMGVGPQALDALGGNGAARGKPH